MFGHLGKIFLQGVLLFLGYLGQLFGIQTPCLLTLCLRSMHHVIDKMLSWHTRPSRYISTYRGTCQLQASVTQISRVFPQMCIVVPAQSVFYEKASCFLEYSKVCFGRKTGNAVMPWPVKSVWQLHAPQWILIIRESSCSRHSLWWACSCVCPCLVLSRPVPVASSFALSVHVPSLL